MAFFVKKPVVIQAIKYTDVDSVFEIMDTFGSRGINNSDDGLYITTLEGVMKAKKGDWIIRGINGEIYPCKPDIFDKTYEPVTKE